MRNARSRQARRPLIATVMLGAVFGLGAGCGDIDGSEPLAQSYGKLAHDGPWKIPEETKTIGDTQYVSYDDSGPWNGGAGCSGSFSPGGQILRNYLYDHFPQIQSIGGYSCRQNTASPSKLSIHGTGRALDIMIPTVGADLEADNDAGDPIGNWLIENAEAIGIQYIIWDVWSWNASRASGNKERAYTGPHPHKDHLHIEINEAAAAKTVNWFDTLVTPPPSPECDPVPAEGRVIDERDNCFMAFGPTAYWRSEQGVGYDDTLLWTNAYDSSTPSNWARWHFDIINPGVYRIDAFIAPEFGIHTETAYGIAHGPLLTSIVLDQSQANEWVTLGEFEFEAGADQHLSVYDTSTSPPPANQQIVADAIRIVPVKPNDPGTGGSSGGGSGAQGGTSGAQPEPGEAGTGGSLFEGGQGGSSSAGTHSNGQSSGSGDSGGCQLAPPGSTSNLTSLIGLAILGLFRLRRRKPHSKP